jgi:porin
MAWREAGSDSQGLWFFARAGGAPRNRAWVEFAADFGLNLVGPLPGRDEDTLGVGFVHARISRDVRAFERLDAAANGTPYQAFSSHESVLEGFYSIKLREWWSIQPDVQWIFNPGGTAAGSDAVVAGLRTTLVF